MNSLVRLDPAIPGPLWQAVAPYLQKALEEGGGNRDWDLADIGQAAVEGRVDVWALLRDETVFGGAVSCIKTYPKRRCWDILLLGTDPHTENDWFQILAQIRPIARQVGASSISGTGRPGWARKLGARERRVFELGVSDE